METQVQNNVKNKQTKTREEKNVHERRSKKKKKNGTRRLSKSSRISEKHVRPHELLYYTTIPRGGGEYPEGNSCFSIYHIS